MPIVELGDTVEDGVSGFRGVAIARHTFLHGNTSISVQPEVERYGVMPEAEVFTESRLNVIKARPIVKLTPIIVKQGDE